MMKELLEKYRELISYVFWGVMTTLVNYAIYFVCTRAARLDPLVANVIAWIGAVAFAYVVNKLYVFRSLSWERNLVLREAAQFVSARVASFLLEEAIMAVFVTWLRFPDGIVKVGSGILVILINYVLSKLVIFKK